MKEYQSLSHTRCDCNYHLVYIPKCQKKAIYGALCNHLGEIFRELTQQRECNVVEGHLMQNHMHIFLGVPHKYSVSNIVGFIKGKSRILIVR
jgi:putative transposase